MKYKALIRIYYTKRDTYGNVYHVAEITHPTTGKRFNTDTPSSSNIVHILNELFGNRQNYYITEICTHSTRLSSLPSSQYLNCCSANADWKKALRSIGYRLPKKGDN